MKNKFDCENAPAPDSNEVFPEIEENIRERKEDEFFYNLARRKYEVVPKKIPKENELPMQRELNRMPISELQDLQEELDGTGFEIWEGSCRACGRPKGKWDGKSVPGSNCLDYGYGATELSIERV